MYILRLIERFKNSNLLSAEQSDALADILTNRRFSLYTELRLTLYFGVFMLITGIGLTVKEYFAQIGHFSIISFLSAAFLASFAWCFLKGANYSNSEVKSPNIIFDYVLFFGCTLYSIDISYIETHFHILKSFWSHYLLFSSLLFFFLAYRFDNRMALSLALSTLAAWFGFELSGLKMARFLENHRLYAVSYGLIVLSLGAALDRYGVKKHFLPVFLNFASHFLFIALVSGVIHYKLLSLYFLGLIAACIAASVYSARTKSFAYMLYAVIYGYIGFSAVLLEHTHSAGFIYLYYIFSSVAVAVLIFRLSRIFKSAEGPQ